MSGLPTTVSLWRSLFTLLQDEDQEIRDSASDFISNVPAPLLRAGTRSLPRRGTSPHNYYTVTNIPYLLSTKHTTMVIHMMDTFTFLGFACALRQIQTHSKADNCDNAYLLKYTHTHSYV